MEPTVALGVGDQATAIFVVLAALGIVFATCLGEVVVVDEVVARIVWGSI